ncbi:MAG TPA: methionine synthase [Actinomycetota bacterium]|nr:methionine synthase [Actinomycetota bacterium]
MNRDFEAALNERVLVFDGAMGTMLQAADLSLDDYQQLEGCSEILCVTRPDVVKDVHAAYFEAGADAVETNSFGSTAIVLGEYGIADRVVELNQAAARLAREVADDFAGDGRPRWVVGSMGPGTKLPTLGHTTYDILRATYGDQAFGLLDGGADVLLVETCQDLLQLKAAVAGAFAGMRRAGRKVPLMAQVTVETTGQMLLGSDIAAALAAVEPLGVDLIGMNCATGPAEMGEHLRHLAQHARTRLSCLPNAGLPELRDGRPWYPLTPAELAEAHTRFVAEFGLNVVGGCCGTTPEHIRQVVEAVGGHQPVPREPVHEPGLSSLYQAVPLDQDITYLTVGERCNANGSRKFRDLMLESDLDGMVRIAKDQIREGAHVLDVCVDYVGRDGVPDMDVLAERLAHQSTMPIMLDSTQADVIEAGLKRFGGRAIINSINLEDGENRMDAVCPMARQYGAALVALLIDEEGQARDVDWKLRVAHRIYDLAIRKHGLEAEDLVFDALTFPLGSGQEDLRGDAVATIEAIRRIKAELPGARTILGVSNVSFGLSPAARQVLNSVFLHEAREAGLDAAIVSPARILPMDRIDDERRQVALDLVYDRRRDGYDPLQVFMALFEGKEATRSASAEDLAALPIDERLQRRIVDGVRPGLEADLEEALQDRTALAIINEVLLAGMKTVGDLFGAGEMQLPFVLQSAEVMKAAVAVLEPHMDKADQGGKGRIVLATVKGDVHDIGKNLVDIILTNNGYTVHNLGIKQPIASIIEKAEEVEADAIGMSGLLVKSTVVMRENLEELNARGLDAYPILLGGAALNRTYVEGDLRQLYKGRVFYCRDAFAGLRVMDQLREEKVAGVPVEKEPARAPRVATRATARGPAPLPDTAEAARSDVATDVPVPTAPFLGESRVVKGIPVRDIAAYLNESALFRGQWQLRPSGGIQGWRHTLETEARPRLRALLDEAIAEQILRPAVVYGYYPCNADGDELVVWRDDGSEWLRFHFPRQRRDRRLCLADYFRPVASGERDVVAFTVVTMGRAASEATAKLFAADRYREYLELHGVTVEMAEALAEYWHKRIREELGIAGQDADDLEQLFDLGYRGARYSFGYPACPDLEEQTKIFELLRPERIGVELSEEFQLHPEQSTSAIVVHHPEAIYFNAR